MTTLQDRLGEAVAPDYRLERELGRGGMGIVFLGRDVSLDRPVAIKIIRPDRATAVAAERFIREARVLASLSHPNLIAVHRAGESRGFLYYVMDYLEAETLAQRLARGPLSAGEATTIARDVLSALEAVHGRGIVHRDVKPGNIFLVSGHAVIGDLGVAKAGGAGAPALTDEGKAMGSPGYMAPEQMAGRDVGPPADLYAAALVLYEALTGRAWSFAADPALGDWRGVPGRLVRPLQRALAWKPEARYQSAAQFRVALGAAAHRPKGPALRRAAVAVAVVAVAVGLFVSRSGVVRGGPGASVLRIYLPRFAVEPPAMRWLADSIPAALARDLRGAPDLVPVTSAGRPGDAAPDVALLGTAVARDDGALHLTLRSDSVPAKVIPIAISLTGTTKAWERLADSLAYSLLLGLWSGQGGGAGLPLRALPRTRAGLIAWIEAERAFARAQWEAAVTAYQHAIAVDSSCVLCMVRLTDVTRWVDPRQDTALITRYRAALDLFPPHYRRLIEASFAPPDRRIEMEDFVTSHFPDFGLGWFIAADDIFHRGPFEGYSLADAYGKMRRATVVWPDFAPGWEHLAWLAITLDDSARAVMALDSLERLGVGGDPFETAIRALLDAAYRWRFTPYRDAAQWTDAMLRSPSVAGMSYLSAGPRYLLGFGAPLGAIYLGQRFEHLGLPDLEAPGLLAQLYAFVSLGELDSAQATGTRLRGATSDPDAELFLAQLPAALLLADSASPAEIRSSWQLATRELRGYATGEPGTEPARRRAAWMLALLARRAGDTAAARGYVALLAGETGLRPFATLVEADAQAGRGRLRSALASTEPLVALDSGWQADDPFYRAMLHLERAQWHAAAGNVALAVRDLRWHQNNDLRVTGTAGSAPEAAEVDWSLGTLATWRTARLLDAPPDSAAACEAYAAVRAAWRRGDPPYAARADTAARRLTALHCGATR